MKSNLLTLTKVHLTGMTGINRVRYSLDGKEKRKAGLFLALYILVLALLVAFVSIYAILFAKSGLNDVIPALSFALSAAITLVFSLIRGPHMLFAMKDYDMLMSLPVKKSDVIASRLITSYLVNLVFCAVIMIPCTVVYFIYGTFSALPLVLILAAFLLCPVIPLVISDVIGTLITAATINLRHKAIFQTIFGMIALMAIMGVYFLLSFTNNAEYINISQSTLNQVILIYPPAWLLLHSLTDNGLYILILLAASIALAIIFIAVLSKYYLKINSALLSRKDKGKFDSKKLKSGSPFAALYKNEFARLLSSPAYMLNTLSGIMILIIACIATFFVNPFQLLAKNSELDAAMVNELKYIVVPVLMLTIGMSIPSSSSLSLEGNRRWIPYSLPVPSFQILFAKALTCFTITGGAGLIGSVILTCTLSLGAVQATLLFVTAVVYAAFTSLFGIFINTKFRKFDWTSETAVVKNSASATISVFTGMLPPFIVLFLGFAIPGSMLIPLAIVDGLALIAAVLCFIAIKRTRLCDC